MKKSFAALLTLLALLATPGLAGAEFKKTKIAVLDFELKGQSFETKDMGAIVAEWFITALVKEGRFEVVERSMLNKILDEQRLGLSGIIDESTATEIGKLLGVKIIISGSVLKVQDVHEINARIIEVETASIITAENVKSSVAVGLQDLVRQMSVKIIKYFPLEGYIVARDAGQKKTAIDLGRYAGVKPGMAFDVFREGRVIKHPKTGEILDVERILTGKIIITSVRDNISEAEIVREYNSNAIKFGQRVKSQGPLVPVQKEQTFETALQQSQTRADRKRRRRPSTVPEVMSLVRSSNPIHQTQGAKYTVKLFPSNPDLLEAIEMELLKGYQHNPRNRYHAEAMSWFCNVLGRSGQTQYMDTLKEVSKKSKSSKIRGYAKKNYKRLR